MVVMSGDVGCWCALFGTLVGVFVWECAGVGMRGAGVDVVGVATYGSLCDGDMWGESGRVCCPPIVAHQPRAGCIRLVYLLLSWASSLSISSSAISASTLSNHVFLGLQPVFCLQLYTPYISSMTYDYVY